MKKLYDAAKKLNEEMFPGYDFVPTIGGRYERHPRNIVGNLYRIKNPETIHIGCCFLNGRLKKGDLFLCIDHAGDCFQNYMYVEEYSNCLKGNKNYIFGSYGIGDSEIVELKAGEFEILKKGSRVEREYGEIRGKTEIGAILDFPGFNPEEKTATPEEIVVPEVKETKEILKEKEEVEIYMKKKFDRWFILVDHVFKFDIPRGTIVLNVYEEDGHWCFTWRDKKYTTHYGWALVKETSENRSIAIRYWKLVDDLEAIRIEKERLFLSIEKAEKYECDEKSDC